MDFTLNEEHKLIQESAATFAKKEIEPFIRDRDSQQIVDKSLIYKMGKDGFLGICIPKQYGGQGCDYLSLGIICEEFEKSDSTARVVLSVHIGLNSLCLLQWGTEEQKKKYLIPQAKGEKIAGFALTEPNAGSDVSGIHCTATKNKNYYTLIGEKTWISLANTADNFIVFAHTDKSKGNKGISAFIIEKDFSGVKPSSIHGKLGVRAGDTGSLSFTDVKVPVENLLGNEGDGLKIALSAIDNGRYTVASGAVGIISACLESSVKYAKERETFGQEIGKHQLIQQMIAKMEANKEIGKLLYYKSAWLKNIGKRNTKETSLAKWINCNNAFEAASDAIQIHGAYGFSNEFPVERHFRNARGAMIYEGTREIHTLVQAEYALGYRVDKPLDHELPAYLSSDS